MKSRSKLKIRQIICIIILVGVLPMIAITLGVITVSINKDISFGKWESYGIAYQRPLETLLDAVPRYREACRVNDAKVMRSTGTEVQNAFVLLNEAQQHYGDKLQFTPEGLAARKREAASSDSLAAEWGRLQGKGAAITDADADNLLAHLRTAITHSGDTSNLILDPDLDSYYLMDITLCALPQTQDRTAVITRDISRWMAEGTVDTHRSEIAAMAALYKESDLARIDGDVGTVLNEDANFYGISPSLQKNEPEAYAQYKAANEAFLALLNQLADGKPVEAGEFAKSGWNAHAAAQAFWKTSADELGILVDTRIDAYARKRTVSLVSIALAVLLSSAVAYLFIRRLQKTLASLAETLRGNATQLVQISNEVTATSKTLADSANQQATSIEETSSSLEELAGMSKCTAQSASNVTTLVSDTRRAAENGEQEMAGLTNAMTELRKSSEDIARIVKTIDEIAFQTNILALNAAVEAARAGDSGAGFAVVADEVRLLARRSADAAKETSNEIESAIDKTERCAKISSKVCDILRDIAGRVRGIDDSAANMATSSREQDQGIQQINSAITVLDGSTQKNAASAEEGASTAAELDSQAKHLENAVISLAELV